MSVLRAPLSESLGHRDGELTVDVLVERHDVPVETFLFARLQ